MRNSTVYIRSINELRALDMINREISGAISVARAVEFTEQEIAWFRSPIKGGK